MVDALCKGHNAFCVAFGQSNSGKTFTMETTKVGGKDVFGMVAMAAEDILNRVADDGKAKGDVEPE